jgi:hypothetical protein
VALPGIFFRRSEFPNGGWDGNPNRLKDLPGGSLALATNGKMFAALIEHCDLQGLKVLLDLSPGKAVPGIFELSLKRFSEHQSKKAAKHMTSDRLISLVENRPCLKGRFEVSERMLHLPEFFVLECHRLGRKLRVGLEHTLPVESGFFLDVAHINGNTFPLHLEILTVALVSNQAFGSLFELFFQGFYNRLPICSLFSPLPGIEADNVAAVCHPHLFDFKRGWVPGRLPIEVNLPVSSRPSEHVLFDFFNPDNA